MIELGNRYFATFNETVSSSSNIMIEYLQGTVVSTTSQMMGDDLMMRDDAMERPCNCYLNQVFNTSISKTETTTERARPNMTHYEIYSFICGSFCQKH